MTADRPLVGNNVTPLSLPQLTSMGVISYPKSFILSADEFTVCEEDESEAQRWSDFLFELILEGFCSEDKINLVEISTYALSRVIDGTILLASLLVLCSYPRRSPTTRFHLSL